MADLAQAHFLVGFGIAAACDVEIEARVARLQYLYLYPAVRGPQLIELDEVGHGSDAVRSAPGEFPAFGDGRLADRPVKYGFSFFLSDLGHHFGEDRADDLSLQPSLG